MSRARIDKAQEFYIDVALSIDNKVLQYRYDAIKEFFEGNSCLELGPADGIMTKFLVHNFDSLTVVDASQLLLDKIPNYPNVLKITSLFEEYNPTIKFDTIIMEHVLEHIENPVLVLNRVKKWLKPEGVLIIGVPNALSLHRMAAVKMGLLDSEYTLNDRDKVLGHYRVYDHDTLSNDIKRANLTISHTGGVFLKPISYGQMEKDWDDEMISAYYELGKSFPKNCAEIFAICQNPKK